MKGLGAPPASFANLGDFASYLTTQAQAILGDLSNRQMTDAQNAYTDLQGAMPWGSYLVQLLPTTGGDEGSIITHALDDVTTQLSTINSVVFAFGTPDTYAGATAAQQIVSDASTITQQYQNATGITAIQNQVSSETQQANAGALAEAQAIAAQHAAQQGTSPVTTTDPSAPVDPNGTAPAPTLNLPPPPAPAPLTTANPGNPPPPTTTSDSGTMVLPTQTITAPAPTTASLPVVAAVAVGALGLGALLVWMMRAEALNPVESRPKRRKRRRRRRR